MQNNLSINIIISSPPFGLIDGKEGVDLALVCAAFEQDVNLIFVDEGIFHLIKNQNGDYFADKLHDKQLNALAFYDIESLYAEKESLQRFDLAPTSLLTNTILIDRLKINQFISTAQKTVIF